MDTKDDFYLPEEDIEWIGLKKSQYLSKLIQLMKPNDFGFEEFHQFDGQVPQTIENPDKSYHDEDDGKEIRTYVRTYDKSGAYHQVVVGVVIADEKSKTEVYIPVLFFVTRDDEVVKAFSTGEVMSRPILN